MKNLLMLFVCFLITTPAWAEDNANRQPSNIDQVKPAVGPESKDLLVNGEVSIYSDDIFRGISMSNHNPVVQGWLGLSYLKFLNAGVYTTSTNFPVWYSPTGEIAKRYNVYFASVYVPVVSDFILGLEYYHYDFMEYSGMNQNEYFLHLLYKNLNISYMYNPNYLQIGTKYQYISAQYEFKLTDKDSITPLVSTTVVAQPDLVDIKDYQEFRLTYTRDLGMVKVNTIFSTTNRKHYYTDEGYSDTALAFGITLPF
jgi:uncharacterized protein (TIGR02001 family)